MIKKYINQPYPYFSSKWKMTLSVSLFVPLFIIIFQPFGLSEYKETDKIFKIAGYGCVTFILLVFNTFFFPLVFKRWFNEKSWTVRKQILWFFWIIFTIGSGNFIYSSIIFSNWSLYVFLIIQVYTFEIGILPVVILTILKQNVLLSRNLRSAEDINARLMPKDERNENEIVSLVAENDKDTIEVRLSDLLYVESTGNYVKVHYTKDGNLTCTVLRSSLKRIEFQTDKHPFLFKCHRAFIINIHKILKVKGNSQGLKLVLMETEAEIPVSRNLSTSLKEKLNSCRKDAIRPKS